MDGELGISGLAAPEWEVSEWFNLPDSGSTLRLRDFEDRVVYLYCFQSWCPGCHIHGFPTLKAVMESFADRLQVAFVAVQTVFEGFDDNTAQAALDTVAKFGLDVPVGHDVGPGQIASPLMRDYRTGGTPWTVFIDRQRRVRFNGFSITPSDAVTNLTALIEENAAKPPRESGR